MTDTSNFLYFAIIIIFIGVMSIMTQNSISEIEEKQIMTSQLVSEIYLEQGLGDKLAYDILTDRSLVFCREGLAYKTIMNNEYSDVFVDHIDNMDGTQILVINSTGFC